MYVCDCLRAFIKTASLLLHQSGLSLPPYPQCCACDGWWHFDCIRVQALEDGARPDVLDDLEEDFTCAYCEGYVTACVPLCVCVTVCGCV